MSKLSNQDKPITKADLQEFYQQIFPFLGGNKAVDSNPVGHFGFFLLPSAPAGYLVCEGQQLSASAFPLLFDALKEFPAATRATWGAGTADWVTTFDLPNLKGEFIRCSGTNGHSNQGNGANVGIHQDGTEHSSFGTGSNGTFIYSAVFSNNQATKDTGNKDSVKNLNKGSWQNRVGADAYSNIVPDTYTSRPTNTSLLGCVKYTYVTQEVNYNNVEHIIGTWLDGSILYEKTIYVESVSPSQGQVIDGSLKQENVTCRDWAVIGIATAGNNIVKYGEIWVQSGDYYKPVAWQHVNGFAVAQDQTITDIYATVRYTKNN